MLHGDHELHDDLLPVFASEVGPGVDLDGRLDVLQRFAHRGAAVGGIGVAREELFVDDERAEIGVSLVERVFLGRQIFRRGGRVSHPLLSAFFNIGLQLELSTHRCDGLVIFSELLEADAEIVQVVEVIVARLNIDCALGNFLFHGGETHLVALLKIRLAMFEKTLVQRVVDHGKAQRCAAGLLRPMMRRRNLDVDGAIGKVPQVAEDQADDGADGCGEQDFAQARHESWDQLLFAPRTKHLVRGANHDYALLHRSIFAAEQGEENAGDQHDAADTDAGDDADTDLGRDERELFVLVLVGKGTLLRLVLLLVVALTRPRLFIVNAGQRRPVNEH